MHPQATKSQYFYGDSLKLTHASLLISRSLSSAEPILGSKPDGLKCLVCSDKPVPPAQNTLPGKGIENLTELNLTITETINSLKPNRLVVQFLSDILLRHKALQTRKWLSELLDKFRAKNITALVVLNPFMHSSEEVQAIVDLFNGNIELIEKQVEGQLRKSLDNQMDAWNRNRGERVSLRRISP